MSKTFSDFKKRFIESTFKNKPSNKLFNESEYELREIDLDSGGFMNGEFMDEMNQLSNIINNYLKPNWFDYGKMININKWEVCIEMKKPKNPFLSPKWEVFDSFDEVLKYLIEMLRDTSMKRYLRLLKHKPQYKSIILN